jgi:hypothetical protein
MHERRLFRRMAIELGVSLTKLGLETLRGGLKFL